MTENDWKLVIFELRAVKKSSRLAVALLQITVRQSQARADTRSCETNVCVPIY
jgi:hypothetical protein